MARNKTQGRRKVEMKKIVKEDARFVTFSKRHRGIFKKASELSILCGAKAAIIAFSPRNKVYSFGDPDVESVICRFEHQNYVEDPNIPYIKAMSMARVEELNYELDHVRELVEEEAKRGKLIPKKMFEDYVEKLDLDELESLKEEMLLLAASANNPSIEPRLEQFLDHDQDDDRSKSAQQNEDNPSPIPHDWLKL